MFIGMLSEYAIIWLLNAPSLILVYLLVRYLPRYHLVIACLGRLNKVYEGVLRVDLCDSKSPRHPRDSLSEL